MLIQITRSDLQIPSFPSSLGMRLQHTAVYNRGSKLGKKKYMETLIKNLHMMQNLAVCCRKSRTHQLLCKDHLFSSIDSLQRFINTLRWNTWILGTKHVKYIIQRRGSWKNKPGNGLGNCNLTNKMNHEDY